MSTLIVWAEFAIEVCDQYSIEQRKQFFKQKTDSFFTKALLATRLLDCRDLRFLNLQKLPKFCWNQLISQKNIFLF